MSDDQTLPLAAGAFFGLLALATIIAEVIDLRFYKKNDWNFDLKNPNQWGDYSHGDSTDQRDKVSNETRVKFSQPFFATVWLILSLAFILIPWE